MTDSQLFAHSLPGRPESEWEPLAEHLHKVADLASELAGAFGAAEWGRLAGLWHDLGKYRPEFQARLRGSREAVERAGIGAALAVSKAQDHGLPLAFAIAGHHAGLPNRTTSDVSGRLPLKQRLDENRERLASLLPLLPPDLIVQDLPPLPAHVFGRPDRLEIWIRFLFSALVDADYLATDELYSPGLRRAALAGGDDVPTLRRRLDNYVDAFARKLSEEDRALPVNRRRAEVLAACRAAAEKAPGSFSLTVPTGGGKTLSAMAFALRHAELHGLRRVIAAIPFTSIIEQNAAVYREALGAANVLEHHSGLDPVAAEERDREAETRRRLAAENWDAPVVVTTNVQLFESLFADSPSRCRKLHNIARSVILLDEVQTLPPDFLLAILDILRELTLFYGCTVVLTTATQPALARRPGLPQGLEAVQEIVPDPLALARDLERVHVTWPAPGEGPLPYPDLAREMARLPCVLAVVHRRKDARTLARLLPEEDRFHLSALMCPAHRSAVLAEVKARLGKKLPCRLVSTQLIEAGVDVDFPLVYRCLGGLDSLAQAAGRCNREGRLPEKGRVLFFRAETDPPRGTPKDGLEVVEEMLQEHAMLGTVLRLDDPEAHQIYFRKLYSSRDLDAKRIQPLRRELSFHSVAAQFRLIERGATPIVVLYGEAPERLAAVRDHGPDRFRLRALQPFIVNLFDQDVSTLRSAGALEEVADGVIALASSFRDRYDDHFGLLVDDERPSRR